MEIIFLFIFIIFDIYNFDLFSFINLDLQKKL